MVGLPHRVVELLRLLRVAGRGDSREVVAMTLLLSPHSDDETLFAFFTVLRERPVVAICYPSERDYGSTFDRIAESRKAMQIAGVSDVRQLLLRTGDDLRLAFNSLDEAMKPTVVWAPYGDASHPHHVAVALAAKAVFGDRIRTYHTYDSNGKVRRGERIVPTPEMAELKRRALACYGTQIAHPRARIFYDESVYELDEYVEPAEVPDAAWGDVFVGPGKPEWAEGEGPQGVIAAPTSTPVAAATPPLLTRKGRRRKKGAIG